MNRTVVPVGHADGAWMDRDNAGWGIFKEEMWKTVPIEI